MLLLLLLFFLAINLIRDPLGASLTNSQLIRVPLLFTVVLLNLYYIPEVIREATAMWVFAIVAVFTILIGLPSLVVGPYSIGGAAFVPYADFTLPLVSKRVPALTSFFGDSNALSKLAMYGSFASLYLIARDDNWVHRSMFGVSVFGLYFGHSRSAMLAFLAGISIVGIYVLGGRELGQLSIFAVVVGSILGFGMLLGTLPRPEFVAKIPLSSRGAVWHAAIRRIIQQPILGYGLSDPGTQVAPALGGELRGLSPQNSYLYVTLAAGIFGGVAYFLFLVRALLSGPRDMVTSDAVIIGFCTALFVLGFFEMVTLLGLNQSSVIAGLAFGYLLKAGRA